MKKFFLLIAIFATAISLFSWSKSMIKAQAVCDESTLGLCINNFICSRRPDPINSSGYQYYSGARCGSSVIGVVKAPDGVLRYNSEAGGIGLVAFASVIIRIINILAGVWIMFHLIYSGWSFITGMGDQKAYSDMKDRLTYAVIGLIVLVSAYSIAGLVGYAFYGDASYILNPQLQSAVQTQTTTTP